jgi:site-specific DNA-methyltransferase (adenine-specific)
MRQVVRAALPLGEGIVLDPFMGGGSTIAAACAIGYRSIGIENDPEFFEMATRAVPRLAAIVLNSESNEPAPRSSSKAAKDQASIFDRMSLQI